MATGTMHGGEFVSRDDSGFSVWNGIKRVLEPAASLKLTVVLFALSIFLILAGTFAQVDKDIWEVISLYFRCWFAWIPFQVFFPLSFSPEDPITVPGGIWFPGGKLLGLLLAVNLLSAHVVRFKTTATGSRLVAGLVCIGAGCLATCLIIVSGGNSKGIQAEPWIPYSSQWIGYQGLLAIAAIAAGYGFMTLLQTPIDRSGEKSVRQLFLRSMLAAIGVLLAGVLAMILVRGSAARPSDASLRILWQLTQGTAASLALLGGCWIVFGKRAGIVLLHGGIGLMMGYELQVALTAVETQMSLVEGERTNFVQDIRTFEFAVTDLTDKNEERVVAFPKSVILDAVKSEKPIEHPDLPFSIVFRNYLKNARIRAVSSKEPNLATSGTGLIWMADESKPGAGTDTSSKVDSPAVYATLESKADGKSLGTYLASWVLSMSDETDTVQVDGKTFRIALRPKRIYKPYVFELKDVRAENYLGTSTARNYASTVHLVDRSRNVDEEKTIWMNNPLRFANETFYQSSYEREKETGIEHTVLSVVANSGWMMPYVGCMLVGLGMLTHFMILLVRFLTAGDVPAVSDEGAERAAKLAAKLGMKPGSSSRSLLETPRNVKSFDPMSAIFAAVMSGVAVLYIGMIASPPKNKFLVNDLYRFGQIPVMSEGRTKPIDSAASSALITISGRTHIPLEVEESIKDKSAAQHMLESMFKSKPKITATEWLLEVISEAKIADSREIFRVENLELQETIGVRKREGMRYSRNDIKFNEKEFEKQVHLAREDSRNHRELTVYRKKVLELSDKVSTYDNLKFAFGLQHRIRGETQDEVLRSFQMVTEFSEALEDQGQPVFAVWPQADDEKWHILSRGWIINLRNRITKTGDENPLVAGWEQLLKAYSEDKPAVFNQAVDNLLKMGDSRPSQDFTPWVIRLESYFNHVRPFVHASRLYLIAFILGAIGWLTWPRGFNRAAFAMLLVTLILHTAGLAARLVISGRPPVTNLYSSAVFIGWGCVILGLLTEVIYRIGIGSIVASVAGYATLQIAGGLASDGDTFTVLQAVLDTQFWLATHVTCITLGYATTYLAGLFGIAYIIRGVCTPNMTLDEGRDIHRMIYGTLCFSIFFSFVGTVLGGLWADDSWGRFWGWDPKENAALIIVLWNALALHARWGGMAKERGLAALAVGGNIFVSWSWWGVNALGTGLHSYGFKQGTLYYLALFAAFNLTIIGIGMLPKRLWWSHRRRADNG